MDEHLAQNTRALRILAVLNRRLRGRAAGYWRLEDAHLVLVAFAPGKGLPDDVARAFQTATSRVPLHDQSLGIVRAAVSGHLAVATASELPADTGSGRWLRAFGAQCSVAVPIRLESGPVRAVISIALETVPPDVDLVVSAIAAFANRLIEDPPTD